MTPLRRGFLFVQFLRLTRQRLLNISSFQLGPQQTSGKPKKMRAILQILLLASRHKPVRVGQAYVLRSKIAPFNLWHVIDRAETAA